jgi:hypothetical protein
MRKNQQQAKPARFFSWQKLYLGIHQGKRKICLVKAIISLILVLNLFIFIVDFKSLFNARFPSSLRTCQLRFQVRKLGVNFATSTFQCLNYCKQMSIVQVKINNSMGSSWFSGLLRFVFH